MKNLDDRFEILGLTDIKDYDAFERIGKANENKSKSLEPMKENRSLSPEKRTMQVPQEIFLSSRD